MFVRILRHDNNAWVTLGITILKFSWMDEWAISLHVLCFGNFFHISLSIFDNITHLISSLFVVVIIGGLCWDFSEVSVCHHQWFRTFLTGITSSYHTSTTLLLINHVPICNRSNIWVLTMLSTKVLRQTLLRVKRFYLWCCNCYQ